MATGGRRMTYPDGIDALVNVNATDSLAAGGHAARHNSVNTALVEVKDYLVGALGSKLNIAGGKILQIVRATDSTDRSTTSTTFTDATFTITITPQKSDSTILLLYTVRAQITGTGGSGSYGSVQITDNSNNALSGAQAVAFGAPADGAHVYPIAALAISTPETTSPVTYKVRFSAVLAGRTLLLQNANNAGRLYAIEVSA